jgi:hypothetical protein
LVLVLLNHTVPEKIGKVQQGIPTSLGVGMDAFDYFVIRLIRTSTACDARFYIV